MLRSNYGSRIRAGFLAVALLLFLPPQANSEPRFYLAGNGGADRCKTTDCMCKVRPGSKPENPTTTVEIERRYSIYFPNAVHEMTSTQSQALTARLTTLHEFLPRASASVMAYTDGCGTTEYNTALAQRRLQTAVDGVGNTFRVTNTLIHPEAPPSCPLPEARRVDIIVHTSRNITTLIDKIPADVYLIDASGSMWSGWREWIDVVNASYKPGARIYVTMTQGCYYNQVLDSITPQGGTEIWYAYWKVLEFVRPGETLAIISDFESDRPLRAWERQLLADKVRDSGVRVIAVRL